MILKVPRPGIFRDCEESFVSFDDLLGDRKAEFCSFSLAVKKCLLIGYRILLSE